MMDPKPAKRIVATRRQWDTIAQLAGPACIVCLARSTPFGLSLSHLVPRSQRGDDVIDNIVRHCGSGTTGCHGLIEAHDDRPFDTLYGHMSVRQATRVYLEEEAPEKLAYCIEKKSRVWLDENFPRGVR